jgi:hypothetical protein
MKKLFIIMVLASISLMPGIPFAQAVSSTVGVPPVNQALVPEGFFAMKLSEALNLGSKTEAEAEATLASLGIVPKNGWIADYPVTPDVLIELQGALGAAADSRKISMNKDEATKAVQGVAAELGLPPVAAEGQGSQTASPGDYGEYSDPSEVNNYYDNEGPPVVTYYPPPSDYDYLYAWVPSPFWCAGFFFPGFFVLNDFDIVVVVDRDHDGHHHHHVTNHILDPKTHRVATINPATRTIGGNFRSTANLTERGSNSSQAGKGASAILNRSLEKTGTATVNKGVVPRTNAPSASSTTGQGTGRNGVGHGSPIGRSFEGSHGSSPSGGFSPSHGGGGFFGGGFAGRGFGGGGGCRGRC